MNTSELVNMRSHTSDDLRVHGKTLGTNLNQLAVTFTALQQKLTAIAAAAQTTFISGSEVANADEVPLQAYERVQQVVSACHHELRQLVELLDIRAWPALRADQTSAGLPALMVPEQPSVTLSLKQVAAWQLPSLVSGATGERPAIIAALPSLQRGAVWKPHQVELLWDSILRGFPVGSLVVSRKLPNQTSRSGASATTLLAWSEDEITHHLLDGQQRCNAIALGFLDPFASNQDASGNQSRPKAILWLDLRPNRFAANSSRSFIARVCTEAHPWGYGVEDKAGRLGTADVRDGIESVYYWPQMPSDPNYQRPHPVDIWPLAADVPLPMAWLLKAAEQSQTADNLWQAVRERCEGYLDALLADEVNQWKDRISQSEGNAKHWTQRAVTLLSLPLDQPLINLGNALLRVNTAHLVALNVSDRALHQATRQELVSPATLLDTEQRIANVEHLFQRLNSLGTELRGDELLYSMVKAYWPGIEQTIEAITPRPPATQVALLGARLALSDLSVPEAAPVLSVAALRGIAQSNETSGDSKLIMERRKAKDGIDQLFALNKPASGSHGTSSSIGEVIRRVDNWLLYDVSANSTGLPPVLRSRMAEQTPEVFLFLMSLAKVSLDRSITPTPTALKRLRGLTTALHWFGQDRAAAITKLWNMGPLTGWLNGDVYNQHTHLLTELKRIGQDSDQRIGLINLLNPDDLGALILVPTLEKVHDWRWWNTLIHDPSKDAQGKLSEEEKTRRETSFWPLLSRLKEGDSSKYLLIFGQRDWMRQRFPYDPSITGYWEDHNRPWDYDHILPQYMFTNWKRTNTFLKVCQEWGNTIGNMHILPFEQNRSRQNDLAIDSLPGDAAFLRGAFLDDTSQTPPGDLRSVFSITVEHVTDSGPDPAVNRQKVHEFVIAARIRMLRLYTDWFISMDIGSMM